MRPGKIVAVLALAALAAQAGPALATTPTCTATISKLRYRPHYDVSCSANIVSVQSFVRVSSGATVPATATALPATTVGVDATVALVPGAQYRLRLNVDDGAGGSVQWGTTWRTLPPPAHPNLHVKYITAIPADAVLDIAHRMDGANIFAVPRASDFVDASAVALTATEYAAALRKHQSALVVTDETLLGSAGLAGALTTYCNHGHGVVVAGQTHWLAGGTGWSTTSAIGAQGGPWEKNWSLYYYEDMPSDRVIGGTLALSSVKPHFLTKGLKAFQVIGPGSGEVELRDYAQGKVLATLKPNAPYFNTYGGQDMIAEHQIGAGRVADLGFRPWSSAVSQGGFDPSVSPGGALTARALWWAMNRIPPYDTHFTSKPANPSNRSTLIIAMGSKDSDEEFGHAPHYLYRVDGGGWKHAVGTSFVLYHIATGRYHTIEAKAVDSGGNVDPHPAVYRFYVEPGAMG